MKFIRTDAAINPVTLVTIKKPEDNTNCIYFYYNGICEKMSCSSYEEAKLYFDSMLKELVTNDTSHVYDFRFEQLKQKYKKELSLPW